MNTQARLRTGIVFLCFCMLYGIILINLYIIQIKHHERYVQLGRKQYHVTVTTYPPRAPITDRTGKTLLAMNNDSIAAFIMPKHAKKPEELKNFLQKHFPRAYTRLHNNPDRTFMYVCRRLNDEQRTCIEEADLADIHLLREPNRFYPLACAGQIVGITTIDNKGACGIEMQFNEQLIGQPTVTSLEKDARSGLFYFTKETHKLGTSAAPLQLTIDSDLQFLAHESLKEALKKYSAHEGAVLIMNPDNGEITAMVSLPDFNPNDTRSLNIEHMKNKTVAESYELGSVIKVFAALAALEEGVVTPDELIDCENKRTTYVDGRKVNTARTTELGVVTFSRVIEKSNNIGIAKVATRVGEKTYDHYCRLGFGTKTHIELPGEQSGFVNHPSNWSKQSIMSLSYGYEISATLLQLAKAFAIVATDGFDVQPTILMQRSQPEPQRLYSQESIATVQDILENTTLHGTTHRARIKGYKVMSKTGTANLLVNGKYSDKHNIYTCAGIVQKDDYKRVIVTFVKEAQGTNLFASTVAAPLFEKIAERTLIHDRVI